MKTTTRRLILFAPLAIYFYLSIFSAVAGQWVRWDTGTGGNGHWYKAVATSNSISWRQADQIARAEGGYLTTIASASENSFVFSLVNAPQFFSTNNGAGPALGGFQPSGSPEPNGGWSWVTEEPWAYSNWYPGQPNNNGTPPLNSEDRLQFFSNIPSTPAATWNDFNGDELNMGGYVIERDDDPENLVANGSFEIPVLGPAEPRAIPAGQMIPWQTTEGTFELWSDGFASGPSGPTYAADGRQNLEILSQTNSATVSQSISTEPGKDYVFSFFHTPRPGVDSVLTVRIDGQTVASFDEIGVGLTNFHWLRFRTNFTASGTSTTISFSDRAESATSGTHLDGVSVKPLAIQLSIRVLQVEISWETVTGKSYQPQYRSSLTTNIWVDLGAVVNGNGATYRLPDTILPDEPQRFYRVVAMPVNTFTR